MKKLFAILMLSTPAFADGDPNILRAPGFEFSSIYHIDGAQLPVLCDCETEVAGAFFIEVSAPFEQVRHAMMAGMDMATRYCGYSGQALRGDSADLSVIYEINEHAAPRWVLAGICT